MHSTSIDIRTEELKLSGLCTSVLAVSALAGAGLATEGTLPTFLSALSSGRALLLMLGLFINMVVSIYLLST